MLFPLLFHDSPSSKSSHEPCETVRPPRRQERTKQHPVDPGLSQAPALALRPANHCGQKDDHHGHETLKRAAIHGCPSFSLKRRLLELQK